MKNYGEKVMDDVLKKIDEDFGGLTLEQLSGTVINTQYYCKNELFKMVRSIFIKELPFIDGDLSKDRCISMIKRHLVMVENISYLMNQIFQDYLLNGLFTPSTENDDKDE